MKHGEHTKSQSGFSLVELMIVVAIIGTVASLAVVGFGQYKRRVYLAEMRVTVKAIFDDISSRNEADSPTSYSGTALFGYGRTYAQAGCKMIGSNADRVGKLNLTAGDCTKLRWSYVVSANFVNGVPVSDTITMIILSRYMSWPSSKYYNSLTGEETSSNYDSYTWTPDGGYVTVKETQY